MDEDILAISGFFLTIIIVTLGVPLVRAWVRRQDRTPVLPPTDPRLDRIEHAIEAIAVEVERISEGQRFVTRLLADREPVRAQLMPEKHEKHQSP
jgi:hypothetical protein